MPNKSTEVVTIMVMFGVGSRYEKKESAGISHVLEHMHYKGTKKRPTAIAIAEFIDSLGAENNAFTGKEVTGYYTKLRPKHLEKGFDFLADLLQNPIFDAREMEREKNVILQEINMYEDLPMEMVGNYFERVIFGDNALGREVIGTKESVKSVSREALVSYRDNYYQAENTVIVVAGNFGQYSEEALIDMLRKYFIFGTELSEEPEPVAIGSDNRCIIYKKPTEQSHIILGFKTVPINHPDYFSLELLATILGGSMSSRMFVQIRERRGLAYSVKTYTSNYKESGTLFTQAGVEHDKADEALKAIADEYRTIREKKVPAGELNKAKEVIVGKMMIKLEDSGDLAHHYATEALLSEKIMTPNEIIKAYSRVTQDDILKLAQKYFTKESAGLAFIGHGLSEENANKIINSL